MPPHPFLVEESRSPMPPAPEFKPQSSLGLGERSCVSTPEASRSCLDVLVRASSGASQWRTVVME
eukprot:6636691-Alexandrium_andersonii.AAC.1